MSFFETDDVKTIVGHVVVKREGKKLCRPCECLFVSLLNRTTTVNFRYFMADQHLFEVL